MEYLIVVLILACIISKLVKLNLEINFYIEIVTSEGYQNLYHIFI